MPKTCKPQSCSVTMRRSRPGNCHSGNYFSWDLATDFRIRLPASVTQARSLRWPEVVKSRVNSDSLRRSPFSSGQAEKSIRRLQAPRPKAHSSDSRPLASDRVLLALHGNKGFSLCLVFCPPYPVLPVTRVKHQHVKHHSCRWLPSILVTESTGLN